MALAERARVGSMPRFGRTERALHWASALAFGVLTLTGLVLWLPVLATLVNDRPLVKAIHLWSAVLLGVAVVLIVLAGDRRALRRTARDVDRYDRYDRAWLRGAPQRAVRGGPAPPAGRFNAGQKLNVAIVCAAWLLFGVSGTFLYLGERDHTFQLGGMLFLHDVLTLAMLPLVFGHIYMAVLNPNTAGGLQGMTRGSVDAAWAERHHPRWDPDADTEDAAGG
jgi:formate dehydrogenase subunit gamma